MLLDALIASVLGTIILLSLFILTENILLTDAENLKLTVSHTHLRSVEGYWRRAKFLGQEIQVGDRLCRLYPQWVQGWCDDWMQIKAEWHIDAVLCIARGQDEIVATIRMRSHRCPIGDGPVLQYRWPAF
ncbi:hypothetical protein [Luminiphilus sp. nBUS_07]|uniref:hypothetical protein n=1 Tax=Luminiphilus sp. nBUS_07 TaxID=3395314 RepID=UPI003EBD626D|tara:strand:- start:1186 stop:1575 length:390 start_codon:yes stop_codon:yes gene_type:complete